MAGSPTEGLEAVGAAADLLGVIMPGLDIATGIVGWMMTSPGPDPMMVAIKKLDSRLNEIEDLTLTAWVTAREDNLAFLLAHSSSALQTAHAFLRSGESTSSPQWAPRLALADRDSLVAVHTFVGDLESAFWLRPHSLGAISQSGSPRTWMDEIPDRPEVHSFGRVWDHRWAMPAVVYAITVRLTVLRVIGAELSEVRREVRRYNRFITLVFQKMESGIRSLDEYSPSQIHRFFPRGVPIVAVDIYGGNFIGGEFSPLFRPGELGDRPVPEGLIPTEGDGRERLESIFRNARKVTQLWRQHVAISIGLPELLRLAGALENLLTRAPTNPPQPSRHSELFSAGSGTPPEGGGFPNTGTFYGVREDGNLLWYRYAGIGDPALTGLLVWHPGSGNPIGNGWGGFKQLVGCGDGIIVGIEDNGDLRWYRYEGRGEADVSGSLGWHPNSSNVIGNGWQGFIRIFVAPRNGPANRDLQIFGVAANGDLHWYSYTGNGEHDPAGVLGWRPNSGNRIGNGWQSFRHIHGSGNVFFAVALNGDLLWYSYSGQGEEDVSGAAGWHSNSSNPIGRGWQGMRHIFGSVTDLRGFGHVVMAVNQNGELFWFKYTGQGENDVTGSLGWEENSGNRIEQGF